MAGSKGRSLGVFGGSKSGPGFNTGYKSMVAGHSRGGPPAARSDGAGESVGSLGARSTQQSGGQSMRQKINNDIPARKNDGLGFGGFAYDKSMSEAGPENYERMHDSRTR